jgi:hypothetical protein
MKLGSKGCCCFVCFSEPHCQRYLISWAYFWVTFPPEPIGFVQLRESSWRSPMKKSVNGYTALKH